MKNTNTITLNLGLLSNKEFDGLTQEQILSGFDGCLSLYGINMVANRIEHSHTENTLIAKLSVNSVLIFNLKNVIAKICEFLQQDAIAYKLNDKGFLIYNSGFTSEELANKVSQWGSFNEEYFLNY